MRKTIRNVIGALALGTALLQPNLVAAPNTKPASVISLGELKSQLMALQNQVSATVASLQQVKDSVKNEAALSKAAAEFQTRFNALEAQVGTVRKQAVVVKARAKEHFEFWHKDLTEMQNAKLREKAQERFTETQEQFDKIISTAQEAKEEALPFVSDLKDITLYLEADLSQDAVKSLSNTIWKLGNRSKSVIGSIGDVIEQIDRVIKSLPKK
jgi:hypothetical protein